MSDTDTTITNDPALGGAGAADAPDGPAETALAAAADPALPYDEALYNAVNYLFNNTGHSGQPAHAALQAAWTAHTANKAGKQADKHAAKKAGK